MQAHTYAITMTSREIAELTGKELAHVHRDIRAMLDELKKDDPNLDHPLEDKDSRGYTTGFHLNRELTETLLTGYSASARLKVIRRWHDLEAEKASGGFKIPQTLHEALRLAADQSEQIDAQKAQLAIAAPKVAALDLISAGKDAMTVTEASKVLGMKRKDLTSYLNQKGWIYRQNGSWVAYDAHIKTGSLQYKEASYTDDKTGMVCKKPYCHITPKGMTKLAMMIQ